MSEQEAAVQENPHPEITENLFWEDVQIGMRMARSALLFLAVVIVLQPMLAEFLVALLLFLAGAGALHGFYMFFEIPADSEARLTHRGMIGTLFICFAACVVNYFLSESSRVLTLVAAASGALANILFYFTVMSIAGHLRVAGLFATSSRCLLFGGILSATFLAIYIFTDVTGLFLVLSFLIGLTAVLLATMVASQTARTIELLKAGEVFAQPDFESVATSHEVEETDVYEVVKIDSPTKVFSDNEWKDMETDDRGTAKVFVGLMTGIFGVGVVLYIIILCTVAL